MAVERRAVTGEIFSWEMAEKLQARLRKTVETVVPLLILAIPSFWLIAAVPPLWRDADAYVQTVFPPGAPTILSHGLLYCTLSRLPLWFGYLISGAGPAVWLGHFIKHTQLTDTGPKDLTTSPITAAGQLIYPDYPRADPPINGPGDDGSGGLVLGLADAPTVRASASRWRRR